MTERASLLTEERLLPCPFCGADDAKLYCFSGVEYQITCGTCGAQSRDSEDNKDAAIFAWNKRSTGWQDISTAPRDGRDVWVYVSPKYDLPGFQCRCAYHPDAGWCADELREVTHWMPLPAPPVREDGTS